LAEVSIEGHSLDGFPDPRWHMEHIRRIVGDDVVGMTPTVFAPAMLSSPAGGRWITRQVNLVGIDERTYSEASDFGRYLQHPENRRQLSFQLRDGGYDVQDHLHADGQVREEMKRAGWPWRRINARRSPLDAAANPAPDLEKTVDATEHQAQDASVEMAAAVRRAGADNPFRDRDWNPDGDAARVFDPAREQHTGIVLGIALATYRTRDVDGEVKDGFLLRPGDDVQLTFPSSGTPPKGVWDSFTVVDFYESKMYEYDSTVVFVPMRKLQELRGMIDPATGVEFVNSIRIKLRPGADPNVVRDRLRMAMHDGHAVFPPNLYAISTWRDKQGPILQAVELETATLNILLFLIIAVAGFGIMATFFMIVVEKTKDIGILKSLGASAAGVMGIFVSYGLVLGCVGAGVGLCAGLLFVRHINQIRSGLERLTGREVFDPTIYYFHEIPTIVNPVTVAWVLTGAVAIAVVASVLPALRAAMLHPVDALRA
jgi:lipoprotein-releasing system permease protein